MDQFEREELLLNKEGVEILKKSRVIVFGVGGVGGYAVEALARAGVGSLDLVDGDTVALSNLNRQIIALHSTVGKYKAEVAAGRVRDINPECRATAHDLFYLPETEGEFDFQNYDYVVDAIDMVTGKIAIAVNAYKSGTPVISAMGAGNKLDATAFEVADIYQTSVCPLARVMRKELKSRGVPSLKVVYSKELPIKVGAEEGERPATGSVSFVPSVAGLILAGEVIKDLIKNER